GSVGIDLNGGTGNFTVTNFGAITAAGSHSIFGYGFGVKLGGTSGTVANYGTITVGGTPSVAGVYISSPGVVINGNGAAAALIMGGRGVEITNAGTVSNFGAISGTAGGGVSIAYAAGFGDTVVNGGPGATG